MLLEEEVHQEEELEVEELRLEVAVVLAQLCPRLVDLKPLEITLLRQVETGIAEAEEAMGSV